jgi:hypothetical protein
VNNEGDPDYIGMFIAHPDWNNVFGICDKRTSGECNPAVQDCRNNYICHDQAVDRAGTTRIMACPPGVEPGGPGCVEGKPFGGPSSVKRTARKQKVGMPDAGAVPETGIPTRPKRYPKKK